MNRHRRLSLQAASLVAAIVLASGAKAQTEGADPAVAAPFGPPVEDEPVFVHVILNQFEGRFGRDSAFRWDGEAWAGTDAHRLWLKSEGDVEEGVVSGAQHEVLYARPITTYFDVQAGLRYDLDNLSGRGWAAFGVEGLAPNFFHVSATAYASDAGYYGAKLFGSFDLLITQRLILQPAVELDAYTKADPKRLIGPGISELDTGLRLRYEISRKFAPYLGITYEKRFGRTARLAAGAGGATESLSLALGIRAWY